MQLLPTQLASSQDSSDEEENGQPVIERKDSANVEMSFEEGLPTSNFFWSWIFFCAVFRVNQMIFSCNLFHSSVH